MAEWILDRSELADPILQVGWSGLSLLLHHGERSGHYPEVKQSKTLSWVLEETKITIQFETPADLDRLLYGPLGDFRDGIGVIPGYETNPNAPGFYATARAHTAICGGTFSEKRGKRRSASLGDPKKRKAHETEHGKVVTTVENVRASWSTEANPKWLSQTVTPHRRALPLEALSLGVTGKGKLKGKQKFGTAVHPRLSQWNLTDVQGSPQDFFLSSFACLGYFWVHTSQNKSVGLGNTASTWSEIDKRVKGWQAKSLLTVAGGHAVASWTTAALLDLPAGSYPTVYTKDGSTVIGTFHFHTDLGGSNQSIYEMLGHWMERVSPKGAAQHLFRVSCIPVKVFKDKEVSVFDILLRNLECGQRWCIGLGEGVLTNRNHYKGGNPLVGWLPREREILSGLAAHLGDPMERAVAQRMSSLHRAISTGYKKTYKDPWVKARKFTVATHLNRVNTKGSLLQAINAIQSQAGNPVYAQFNSEEFEWLLTQAEQDLVYVKHLLILACGGVDFRTPEQRDQHAKDKAEAKNDDTPVINYDDN